MELHERIKLQRLALGLTHEQVAIRVSTLEGLKKPLAWQTVQQWENNGTIPRSRRLKFVAQALEMTLEELLGFTPERQVAKGPGTFDAPHAQARESQADYVAGAWPFKIITSGQLAQLPGTQLADLERFIVDHLMNPMNVHWRRIALDLAAEYDQKNKDDQLTNFVRAVDLKARALRAARLQEEDAST